MDERFGLCNSTSVMKLLCGVVAVKDRPLSDFPTLCKLNTVQIKINDMTYCIFIVDHNNNNIIIIIRSTNREYGWKH